MATNQRSTRIAFQPVAEQVPVVRRSLARTLKSWGVSDKDDMLHAIQLAASELLSNVIRHAPVSTAETCLLLALVHGERIRLGVRDGDPHCPEPAACDDDATTGRGLAIIQHLVAEMNGTILVERTHDDGKIIWIEVPCTCDQAVPLLPPVAEVALAEGFRPADAADRGAERLVG